MANNNILAEFLSTVLVTKIQNHLEKIIAFLSRFVSTVNNCVDQLSELPIDIFGDKSMKKFRLLF